MDVSREEARAGRVTAAVTRLLPFLAALLWLLLAMQGAGSSEVVQPDASRHLMNGVLLHDLAASGGWTDPVGFAKRYYARWPAVSLPYHPPLFPAFEAAVFAVAGVNTWSARLAVALFAAAAALLFYRLVTALGGPAWLAVTAVAAMAMLPPSRRAANDVMLEIPALASVLLALVFLARAAQSGTWRAWLLFGIAAGSAVWIKQQAVFLGLAAGLYLFGDGGWRRLRNPRPWAGIVVLGAMAAAMAALSSSAGTGFDEKWRYAGPLANLSYYAKSLAAEVGLGSALLLTGGGVLGWLRRDGRGEAFYAAWLIASLAFLLVLPPRDERYLYFSYPPLIVLTLLGVRFGRAWIPAAAAAALAVAFAGLRTPPPFLRGPAEMARRIAAGRPQRVLYCGAKNGNFIFAARAAGLPFTILRGDKLPDAAFSPGNLSRIAQEFGIRYVVLERSAQPWPWNPLAGRDLPGLTLVSRLPLETSERNFAGDLYLYRAEVPDTPPPRKRLVLESDLVREPIVIDF